MKYLLDEQLDEVVAAAMAPIAAKFGDEFVHILALRAQGTSNNEIPALCRDESIQCLVSANVRDFGARKFHFQALLAKGPPRRRAPARKKKILRGGAACLAGPLLPAHSVDHRCNDSSPAPLVHTVWRPRQVDRGAD